ncbi:MAG: CPBP family glutamic-type intramembrane protease [Methanomassiliicoccaceae archaeon]|nr:CPBP family glutamic-type intramembrane protease [Methanomassiliicoccaceae archaeon]
MSNGCPRCGEYAADGKSFCGACGSPLGGINTERPHQGPVSGGPARSYQPAGSGRIQPGPVEIFLVMVCIFFLFIVIFETITMFIHSPDIFSFLSDKSLSFFVLVPLPKVIFSLGGLALQIYWAAVVSIILSCVVTTVQKLIEAARSPGGITKPGIIEGTAALWVSVLFCAMFAISFIVLLVQFMIGSDATTPDFGSKIEQMFLLADAAVWEEIVTRLLLIGVPMAVISLIITKKKESLKCLLGGFGMSMTAFILIIVSGAIFGLAHYSGWDDQAWKVLTAGITGAFLGYVFVRFGLYASILMHFATNYLSSFDWMGVSWIGGVMVLLIVVAGFAALLYIIMKLAGSRESIDSLPIFWNGYAKKE